MDSDDEVVQASQEVEASLINNDSDSDRELLQASQAIKKEVEQDKIERFHRANDGEIEQCALDAVPTNTQRRDKWAYNVFTAWAIAVNNRRGEGRKPVTLLENMTLDQLGYFMSKFVLEVRKKDGCEYPPNSLFQIVMGIQSYIKTVSKRNVEFLQSDVFEEFRQVLDGEMKRLTRKGLGQNVKKAEAISVDEEELLWRCGQLGDRNPRVLVNTLLYLNGKHFGLRSGHEHRKLKHKNSQISFKTTPGGQEYLCYREDYSKTVQGGLKHRRVTPKEIEHHPSSNPARCHVRLFKKYLSLCPPDGHDNALYLQALQSPTDKCWYSRQPLGHNTLQKIVPEICRKAGIQGYKTNHSLRVTTATRLYQAGVGEPLIMERTGHRSVTGVRSYTRISEDQKATVNAILNDEQMGLTREATETVSRPDQEHTETTSAPTSSALTLSAAHAGQQIRIENCVVNFNMK
ncbi:hypothetical protein GJAV_G00119940 [Gymnothorax javanicus]|nr:hypothetical protein GJAV_G00119940 [Gymnothorax javanicus]